MNLSPPKHGLHIETNNLNNRGRSLSSATSHLTPSSATSSGRSPSSNRRKRHTRTACIPCRNAKDRCESDDGPGMPCQTCLRGQKDCHWAKKRDGRLGLTPASAKELEERVRLLEERVEQLLFTASALYQTAVELDDTAVTYGHPTRRGDLDALWPADATEPPPLGSSLSQPSTSQSSSLGVGVGPSYTTGSSASWDDDDSASISSYGGVSRSGESSPFEIGDSSTSTAFHRHTSSQPTNSQTLLVPQFGRGRSNSVSAVGQPSSLAPRLNRVQSANFAKYPVMAQPPSPAPSPAANAAVGSQTIFTSAQMQNFGGAPVATATANLTVAASPQAAGLSHQSAPNYAGTMHAPGTYQLPVVPTQFSSVPPSDNHYPNPAATVQPQPALSVSNGQTVQHISPYANQQFLAPNNLAIVRPMPAGSLNGQYGWPGGDVTVYNQLPVPSHQAGPPLRPTPNVTITAADSPPRTYAAACAQSIQNPHARLY